MKGKQSDRVYPLRRIVKEVLSKRYDRMMFVVEWEQKKANGTFVTTRVPLENFIETPVAIVDFVNLQHRAYVDKCERDGLKPCLVKEIFPERDTRSLMAKEYVPKGNEVLKKIYSSFAVKIKRDMQEYYSVRFVGIHGYFVVRLLHMEYYHPFELLLFWKRTGRNGPKFGPDK